MKVDNIKPNIPSRTVQNRLSGKFYTSNFTGGFDLAEAAGKVVREGSAGRFGWVRRLFNLSSGLGESFNNWITAFGTACIAPIFIINNPLAHKSDADKKYAAWRQPISAVIALSILNPTANWWRYQIVDKATAYGKIPGIDLSAKPDKSLFAKKIKENYKLRSAEAKAAGKTFEEYTHYKDKDEYSKAMIKAYQSEAQHTRLTELREKPDKISILDDTEHEIDKKAKAQIREQAMKKGETVMFKSEMVSPDDLAKAKLEMCQEYLGKEPYNYTKSLKDDNIKNFEEFIGRKGKKIRAKLGIDKNAVDKMTGYVDKEAFERAIKNVEKGIQAETAIKTKTTKIGIELAKTLNKEKSKLYSGGVDVDYTTKEKELRETLFSNKLNELKEEAEILQQAAENAPDKKLQQALLENPHNETLKKAYNELKEVSEMLQKADIEHPNDETIKMLQKASEKNLENATLKDAAETAKNVYLKIRKQGSIEKVYKHTCTSVADLLRIRKSVEIKKWLLATTQKTEKMLEQSKKFSGLVFGAACSILACYILNWIYPRFMEKFFPKLANAKQGKEGK